MMISLEYELKCESKDSLLSFFLAKQTQQPKAYMSRGNFCQVSLAEY
jgi:hypothetical protein